MISRVMSELPKAYEPTVVEEKWQQRWQEEGCFHADPHSEKPASSLRSRDARSGLGAMRGAPTES